MSNEAIFWVLLITFGAGSYFGQCVTDYYWDSTPKQWWLDKQAARRAARQSRRLSS